MQTEFRPGDDDRSMTRAPEAVAPIERGPVADYVDALREVQQRESEVLRMGATIQHAAKCLERWRAVYVVNAGAGFPKEVTMIGRSLDASTWPSPQQLADTLAMWHEAAEVARTGWARLPREMRSSVPPPP